MTNESQVVRLRDTLKAGYMVDRVSAFKSMGIADLRSRISDCERDFGMTIKRETVPGKRYRRYFL